MPFDIDHVRKLLSEDFNSIYEKNTSEGEPIFLLPFSSFNVMLRVDNKRDFICVRIPQAVNIDEKHKAAVLEKAMHLNYRIVFGKFGFDPGDGELVFEIYQATHGFEGPWEKYDETLRRMIGIAIHTGKNECKAFQEMNFTGVWADESDTGEPAKKSPYEDLCIPIREGKISADTLEKEDLEKVLDIIIELSVKAGRDKVEDYPKDWQKLLQQRMSAGTGSEI